MRGAWILCEGGFRPGWDDEVMSDVVGQLLNCQVDAYPLVCLIEGKSAKSLVCGSEMTSGQD